MGLLRKLSTKLGLRTKKAGKRGPSKSKKAGRKGKSKKVGHKSGAKRGKSKKRTKKQKGGCGCNKRK